MAVAGSAKERVSEYDCVDDTEEPAVGEVELCGTSDRGLFSAGDTEEGDRGEWGVAGGEDGGLE